MSQTRRAPRRPVDSSWTVRQVILRDRWRVGNETCPTCGGGVDLDGEHHQVELGRDRRSADGGKLTYERRLLSFCDEVCTTAWLGSTDAVEDAPTDD